MSEKFITYCNGGYRLDRKTKDLRVSASFSSLEDAVNMTDLMIKHDWSMDMYREVYDKRKNNGKT